MTLGVRRVAAGAGQRSRPRVVFGACALVFAIAVAVRLFLLTRVPERFITPHTRWESEAIAYSLAETGRFADPYAVPTGPTAHHPPLYPMLIGLIWRVFGLGLAGGYASWTVSFLLASLQCALLPWLAVRFGFGLAAGTTVGVIGAVLAQWPPFVEPPTAIALGVIMLVFRNRWSAGGGTTGGSLLLGAGAGIAFHLHPTLLPVVLGCLAFELWWLRGARRWIRTGAVALSALLACVPWAWRNWSVMHGVFFVRSNLGLELLVGNHDGAVADIERMSASVDSLHPRGSVAEALRVREMGEVAYMREAGAKARAWIAANPGTYARLSAQRALAFWTRYTERPWYAVPATIATLLGVIGAARVLRRLTVPGRAVLLIPLITFPLVYYFVDYLPRYRMPVIWIVYLFAAAEAWHWIRPGTASQDGAAPVPTAAGPA